MVYSINNIEGAFIIKPCNDAFRSAVSYFVLKKLTIPIPEIMILRKGEYNYGNLHMALNKIAKIDEDIKPFVRNTFIIR